MQHNMTCDSWHAAAEHIKAGRDISSVSKLVKVYSKRWTQGKVSPDHRRCVCDNGFQGAAVDPFTNSASVGLRCRCVIDAWCIS